MVLGYENNYGTYLPYNTGIQSVFLIGQPQTYAYESLLRMTLDSINNGESTVYIGDTNYIIQRIPKYRQEDVIYFSPSESPFAFNVLSGVPKDSHPFFASTLLTAVKSVWGYDTATPTLDQYLRAGFQSLLAYPDASLLSLKFLLTNDDYRHQVQQTLDDPILTDFWWDYHDLTPKEKRQDTSSTLNKVRAFMFDPVIRNCLDQKDNKLDFKNKIVLINLDEALIGKENARLMGALVLAQLYYEGMRGLETNVFIDDAYRYGSEIVSMLLDTPLNVVFTGQHLQQFTNYRSLLANVGVVMAFRLTIRDSRELEPLFNVNNTWNLHSLNDHEFMLSTEYDDVLFSLLDRFPLTKQENKIKKRCVSQYTQPIEKIEKRLGRFFK